MIQETIPADSLRRVLEDVFRGEPYRWRDESAATVLVRTWWRAMVDWLDRLAGQHPALFKLLIWGLIAVLVAIAAHTIWLLIRTTRARPATQGGKAAVGRREVRDSAWYAREAARLAGAGRFPAALQAEFVRLMLELDARNVVRFHPSRTPREYLTDLPAGDRRRADLHQLVDELYRYAFGGTGCGPEQFEGWRTRASTERYASST